MPSLSKSRAIVLHLTRHGDSGAVVHVVDSEAGRQGLFVRGLGKGRGVSASAFHNLAILDTVTYTTPRSSLLYLREYAPAMPLNGIRSDLAKSTVALFISEVLYRTLRSDDGDPDLFRWLVESIVRFDAAEGSVANFHLWWMAGYCVRSGFRPQDNWSEERPLFDMVSASFVASSAFPSPPSAPAFTSASASFPAPAQNGSLLSPEESRLLHLLLNSSLEDALAIPLSASRRRSFSGNMLRYLSIHFGVRLEVKSLDVLHAVFI